MSRRSALPALPVALLFCGAVLSMASARAQDGVPDHALGAAAWPGLPAGEREIVDAVARAVFVEAGGVPARYDRLPEVRKAALRGAALRRLGLEARDLSKGWV